MTWSLAKIKFQTALGITGSHARRLKTSMRGYGLYDETANSFIEESNQLLNKIEKGEQFLAGLEEIHDTCPNIEEQFLAEFLNAATLAIATWTNLKPQNASHHSKLSDYCNDLRINMMLTVKPSSASSAYNCKLAFLTGSLSLAALGIAVMASGPWGLLAIAIAGVVVSLVLAAVSGYRLCQNTVALNDVRYEAIVDFVQDFGPKPAKIEAQLPAYFSENEEKNTATMGCF